MTRPAAAILVAIAAAAAIALERAPWGPQTAVREWLGANAMPSVPETIVAIRCDAPGGLLDPLDAALVLRAVERFRPAGVAFLAPVADTGDTPLLRSRVQDATIPLVFTASTGLPTLPNVRTIPGGAPIATGNFVELSPWPAGAAPTAAGDGVFVAGTANGTTVPSTSFLFLLSIDRESLAQVTGSIPGTLHAGDLLAPIDADGFCGINPLAASLVDAAPLDELLLRLERAERGEISPWLEQMLRGRLVVVEPAGASLAVGVAALRNRLVETTAVPPWAAAAGIAMVATLPWWAVRRRDRVVLAFAAAFTWALISLGIYQEFRIVPPVAFAVILPFAAALPVSRRSHKIEERKRPA